MGKETYPPRSFFPVKDIVQIGIDGDDQFGMTFMKGQTGTPHGIGCHAQVWDIGRILIVLFHGRHVGAQHGIIIFGSMEHVD
eukprot:scaffold35725_cov275-Amphora_coffeaeformis.AAC.1